MVFAPLKNSDFFFFRQEKTINQTYYALRATYKGSENLHGARNVIHNYI